MTKRNFKPFITTITAVILMLVTVMPVEIAVAAEEEEGSKSVKELSKPAQSKPDDRTTGIVDLGRHIEVENDIVQEEDSSKLRRSMSSLPDKYDPRNESWFNEIKIKDQGYTGLCWSFATTTAAEIFVAKNQLGQVAAGEKMSPVHLGYFLYNRINDPLGNTPGDRNVIPTAYKDYGYWDIGGNNFMTFQGLANWTGLANESKAPFSSYYEPAKLPKTLSSSLAYDNDLILDNAEFLMQTSEIKEAVKENGSAIIGIDTNGGRIGIYFNNDTNAYYCGEKTISDHIVTVVGWDDSYNREDRRPEADGAWIVQNSWGSDWGDSGYFYVSYEEETMLADALTIDMQEADTYDYNYQYDGNANVRSAPFSAGEKASNIFTVPSGEGYGKNHILEAVGFTSYDKMPKQYNVGIYTDVRGTGNPENGSEESRFSVTVDRPGFHTFELPEQIYLKPGTRYSIVLETIEGAELGVETAEKWDWVAFECSLAKNQSCWYSPYYKTWYDLYDSSMCTRIKGFASEAESSIDISSMSLDKYNGTTVEYGTKKVLYPDISPQNATERDISWSSSNEDAGIIAQDGTFTAKASEGKTTITAETESGISASVDIAVSKADIGKASASLSTSKYTYTGSQVKPNPVVKLNGKTLVKNTDYTVAYSNNINTGKATMTITGKGNYSGKIVKTFVITPKAPKSAICSLYGYDDVKVKWSAAKGASGYYVYYKRSTSDSYTYLGYTSNTSAKKANLYDGKKYYFKIVPYKTIGGTKYKGLQYKTASVYTLKKLSAPYVSKYSSGKVKVKWSNIAGESGYQISRSTKSSGINVVYTCRTTKGKSKVISAKKRKTYYYRVRAYRTVDGKRIYAPWSLARKYRLK